MQNEVVTETISLWIIVETIKPVHSQYKFHIAYPTLLRVRDIKGNTTNSEIQRL